MLKLASVLKRMPGRAKQGLALSTFAACWFSFLAGYLLSIIVRFVIGLWFHH